MKKILMTFIAILVLLVVATAVKKRIEAVQERKAAAAEKNIDDLKFAFDPNSITDIIIRTPKQKIAFKKDKGVWQIMEVYGGMPAEATSVTDFLNSLRNVKGELRTRDIKVVKDYGLSDEEAVHMELLADGRKIEHVLLGIKATGKRNNFLRREGSPAVFVTFDDILTYFGMDKEAGKDMIDVSLWADKLAASFDTAQVKAIAITEKGRTLVSINQDDKGVWVFAGSTYPYFVDPEKVKNYLQVASNLRAFAVAPLEDASSTDKDWTLTLELKDGKKIRLQRLVNEKARALYIRNLDRGFLYKIAIYHFENLSKTDAGFFSPNILGLDEHQNSEVSVLMPGSKKKQSFTGEGLPPEKPETTQDPMKNPPPEPDKVTRIIQTLKYLPLSTLPAKALPPSKEVYTLTVKQGKVSHEITLRDNPFKPNEEACFPLTIDKNRQSFCLDEGYLRSFSAQVDQLLKK